MQRIFVGDVQGCAAELEEILGRARARFGTGYELLSVGDVINRGPASYRALARIREHVECGRGEMVLGNHEIAFLRVALGLAASPPGATWQDLLGRGDLSDWVAWLCRRPLAVFGRLGARRFAMVHAAVPTHAALGSLQASTRQLESRLATGAERLLGPNPRDPEAWQGRPASPRITRIRPRSRGTRPGVGWVTTTAWSTGTGHSRDSTWRRGCADSIPAACTRGAEDRVR
jgi:hypothetical protein